MLATKKKGAGPKSAGGSKDDADLQAQARAQPPVSLIVSCESAHPLMRKKNKKNPQFDFLVDIFDGVVLTTSGQKARVAFASSSPFPSFVYLTI